MAAERRRPADRPERRRRGTGWRTAAPGDSDGTPRRSEAACLAGALVLALAGCRLNVAEIDVGPPFREADWHALDLDRSDRGEVLERFGPPDVVTYTLDHEVLEYRCGHHKGTDWEFLFSGRDPLGLAVQGLFRGLVLFLFPRPEPEEFSDRSLVASATGAAASQAAPVAGAQVLTLAHRQLRFDVARFVLDRRTHALRRKELYRGIPTDGLGEATRLLLMSDE